MPIKEYFLRPNAKASGVNFLDMQDGGSAPAAGNSGTGWNVSTVAATRYSEMEALVKRATGTFVTTVLPSGVLSTTLGDAFRTPTTLKGGFAAGSWTFNFEIGSTFSYGQVGRIRARILKSVNANGSGATEITTATLEGALASAGTSGGSVTRSSNFTWDAPFFKMNDEYLFVQVAWQITTAGHTFNTQDWLLRTGANSKITSTDLKPIAADMIGGVGW